MAKGALARGPSLKIGATIAELEKQRRDPKYQSMRSQISSKLAKLRTQQQNPQAAEPQAQPQNNSGFEQVNTRSNELTQGLFDQVKNQGQFNYQGPQVGQFNPGNYQEMYQKSYDTSLGQFDRSNQPIFDKQRNDFYQMAAERGWDPTSKDVADAYKMQVAEPQNMARQNAMDSAHNAGLQAQNQFYNQASNTYGQNLASQGQAFNQYSTQYQMPYQMLGALSPYYQGQANWYNQQGQQGFLAGQNQLDREQQLAMERLQHKNRLSEIAAVPRGGGGGGGGGLTYEQQLQLMREQNSGNLFNNLVLSSVQSGAGPRVGYGSGFGSGVAAGTGALIGSVLK